MNEEIYGLLGLDPEKIRQQQLTQGLLGAGLNILAASGPSATPRSLGQIVAQGGMAGLQAYEQAGEQAIQGGVQKLKIGELKDAMAERKRIREASAEFQKQIAGATTTRPSTGLTEGGQQAGMLAKQMEGMDQGATDLTRSALYDAGATQQVTDQAVADRAVMNLLRTTDPLEYAKLMARESKAPPAEIQGYQLAVGQGYKGSFMQYQQDLRRAGATNVSVSTERSYGGALAGEVAKTDAAKFEAANAAPRVIETIQETRRLLDSGNVITGIGAQQRLDLARFGQLLGVAGRDTNELVANTQQLFANRAQATLDSIRSSGLGAGQGFSNKDREFLENARLGNITYDAQALRRQLDIEDRVARATVQSWNSRLKNIPQEARTSLGLGEVQLPTAKEPKKIPRYNPATGRVE